MPMSPTPSFLYQLRCRSARFDDSEGVSGSPVIASVGGIRRRATADRMPGWPPAESSSAGHPAEFAALRAPAISTQAFLQIGCRTPARCRHADSTSLDDLIERVMATKSWPGRSRCLALAVGKLERPDWARLFSHSIAGASVRAQVGATSTGPITDSGRLISTTASRGPGEHDPGSVRCRSISDRTSRRHGQHFDTQIALAMAIAR